MTTRPGTTPLKRGTDIADPDPTDLADLSDASSRRAGLTDAATAKGVSISEYVEPERRHLVVGGHRIHALDWGSADAAAPAVLFLHGIRLTAHTWDLVCLRLRDSLRPVAIDLRGHGESEWSPVRDYRVPSVAADVVGIIETIGSPVHLVGHSFGALVATQVALGHADLVERLVLVDAGPRIERVSGRSIRAGKPRDGGRDPSPDTEHDFATFDAAVDAAAAMNPRRDVRLLRSSLRNNLREHPDGTWSWKYDSAGVGPHATFDFRAATRVWERFGDLARPTLIVRGAESKFFTDDDMASAAAVNPLVQTAVVDGAGHTVQGDNPAGLLEVLQPFLTA